MNRWGKQLMILGLLLASFSPAQADEGREGYRGKIYGTVEEMPADRYGIWMIDGHQVRVTQATRLEEEYGQAELGAYVEVKGRNDGQLMHAVELETIRGSRHYDEDRNRRRLDHGEFYGRIGARPETGLGAWRIGDREVVVDERTRLDTRRGPLEVGAPVEVKGSYRDGRFHAYKLKRESD